MQEPRPSADDLVALMAWAESAPGSTGLPHCEHWTDGDGPCCRCGEPNWLTDDGESAAALARYDLRRFTCVPEPEH